ncbi:MAG TPA: SRPBCC domain-containing protein [Thermoleophilaceae bacterium]|jgi:uncharacterized protein YndB with AHSA1/START domain
MPTVVRERTVPAEPQEVWDVVSDPYHLPRWWPRVERVEEATREAWTTVMRSPRGRPVRADYTRTAAHRPHRLAWRQELDESPFDRVFADLRTEITLEPEGEGATRVELKAVQKLRGKSRYGAFMARRAARRQLDEALDGLRRAFTGGE